ncbi:MAG: FadR/GntR family transcriptional regulator, partial [Candidatus Adiutrix sp.]
MKRDKKPTSGPTKVLGKLSLPQPTMPKAINKISAVDKVFQIIQGQIAKGELPVGHLFPPQHILADLLGVSRSTVREAMNKLTMLGLLAAKPGVGTTVIAKGPVSSMVALGQHLFLSSGEITQFIEARLYLEKAAVRLAVLKASNKDIKNLKSMVKGQEKACNQGDFSAFSVLDAKFHHAIIESSQNPLLRQFLELIAGGLSQFIQEVTTLKSAVQNAIHYHHLLVEHLENRDLIKV